MMAAYHLNWPPSNSILTRVTPENARTSAPAIEEFIQRELSGRFFAYLNSEGKEEKMRSFFEHNIPISEGLSVAEKEAVIVKRREFVQIADQALIQILFAIYENCSSRKKTITRYMKEQHNDLNAGKFHFAAIRAWNEFKQLDQPTELSSTKQTTQSLKELNQALKYGGDYTTYVTDIIRIIEKFIEKGQDCELILATTWDQILQELKNIDRHGEQGQIAKWVTNQIQRASTEPTFYYNEKTTVETLQRFHEELLHFTKQGSTKDGNAVPIVRAGTAYSHPFPTKRKAAPETYESPKHKKNMVYQTSNTTATESTQEQECAICIECNYPAKIYKSHDTEHHDKNKIGKKWKRITGDPVNGFQTQGWKRKQQQAIRTAAQAGNQTNKGLNKPKFRGKPNAKNFRQKNPNCSNEDSGNYPKSKFKKNLKALGGNDFIVNLARALHKVASNPDAESNDYSTDEANEEEQISEDEEEASPPPRRLKETVRKAAAKGDKATSSSASSRHKNKSGKDYSKCLTSQPHKRKGIPLQTEHIQLDASLFSKVSIPWFLNSIFEVPRLLIRNLDRQKVFMTCRSTQNKHSLFAIVDSGATISVLCDSRWIQKRFAYESEITGVGGTKITTSMGGLLVGKMESVTNKSYAFATLATIIHDKNAATNLLSIWRITNSGNTVVHQGSVSKGTHGIITANKDFIPFYFCPKTYLWYIEIKAPDDKTNRLISTTDSIQWDKKSLLREIQQGEFSLNSKHRPATQNSDTDHGRTHLLHQGVELENSRRWGGNKVYYEAHKEDNSAKAFKPTPMKSIPISMRDVRQELEDITSEESVDSDTESEHSSSEEENHTEEPMISISQDTIEKQTKDYFTDPKSFADIDDFTNTTMEELNENDKEYEEQLTHSKSDLKDIYLYSTGERIRGTKASAILLKWHIKTNHINKKYLFQLADRIDGMEELRRLSKKTPLPTCHTCRRAKSKAAALPKFKEKRSDSRFHRLHGDMSTYRIRSIEGAKYLMLWKDSYSSFKMPVGMYSKKGYRKSLRLVTRRYNNGVFPKVVRVDNGGEMTSTKSLRMYEKHNIYLERAAPYEHWQNGRAESGIYSLDTRTRLAIIHSNVPKNLWLNAIYYNAEIENAFLPMSRGSDMSCYEAFTGQRPNAEKFHPFGCLCYVHVLKDRRLAQGRDKKLGPTAEVCVFLGFAHHLGMKGFLAASLNGKQLYVTENNISFNEEVFPYRFSHPEDKTWKIPFGACNDFGDDNVAILNRAGERLTEMSGSSDSEEEMTDTTHHRNRRETRTYKKTSPTSHTLHLEEDDDLLQDPEVIELDTPLEVDNHLTRSCEQTSVVRESEIEEEPVIDEGLSLNKELASLQVDTHNSGEKDFQWDAIPEIPKNQLRSGRIVNKGTEYSSDSDNELPGDLEEFATSDYVNKIGIPYQSQSSSKMQFCGVMVDCFNTSRPRAGWSHGPAQKNIYDENHYNQEIDTLMSFLRECKKDDKREYRIQRTQLFYTALLTATSTVSTEKDEPSIKEALHATNPERNQWIAAIQSEAKSWDTLKVFEQVEEIPQDRKSIGCRIILKRKRGAQGEILKYKARAIIQGYNAVQGIDYLDSFSATANPITIRLLLIVARAKGWRIRCQDIPTAYLTAFLPTEVYIKTPKEFQEFCNIKSKFLKILKSVYGLPSSGRNFWKKLCHDLREYGFIPCTADDCLFLYRDKRGGEIIVALVVDDIIQASNDENLFKSFDEFMNNTKGYNTTTDNELSFYLGVAYTKDSAGNITSNQQAYIEKCLNRFNLDGIDPTGKITTPMDPKFTIEPEDIDQHAPEDLVKLYRSQVASLIYIAAWTRPEISYAVSLLSRYLTCPTKKLLMAVHRVYAYLKGTKNLGIRYTDQDITGHDNMHLVAYCDSSDADCKITSRSTGGYVIFLNGVPVSWKSARHNIVSLSTMESEYIQCTLTAIEILYLRETLEFMGYKQKTTICYQDNAACIKLSENPVHKSRSKHIKRRWHFIRECVARKEITLEPINTNEQIADIFTKPLPVDQFLYLRDQLLNIPESERYQRKNKSDIHK